MEKEFQKRNNCLFRFVLITGLFLTFSFTSFSQEMNVSGIVTSAEDDMGIPGVSVSVKGTTTGTITDIDGKYQIKVDQNSTLVFSFVGMTTMEEAIEGRPTINVTMKTDAIGVDEVVVTALGIKREAKALGYAMSEVKGDDLAKENTVNPVSALQGKVAGLSIGGSDGGLVGNSRIQIRGASVLNSNNNQPIFVIDGVIVDNSVSDADEWSDNANDYGNILKNLNSDDYESISVLKGAAATALYGSRGINGAVVIKTKDGKGKKGIGVKITQSLGFDYVYKQPDLQYEFGPGDLPGAIAYGEKDANDNYYKFDPNQFYTREVNGTEIPTKIGNPNSGFLWGPKYDGRDIEDFDGVIRPYRGFKNNMKDAYDLGVNSNTAVALNGTTEKSSFYLSNAYNYREGTSPSNEFERYTLLFKGTYELADWLHAEASISYATSRVKNPGNTLGDNFASGSWSGWYDTKRWNKRSVWRAPHGGTPGSNYGDIYANVPGNSIWFSYNMNSYEQEEKVTRPVVRLTADLTNWISLTVEGNMNTMATFYEKKELGQGYANDGGSYQLRHDQDVSRTGKLVLNMKKDFGDLSTNAIIGGELWDQKKSYTNSYTEGGLIVPGKFFLSNSKEKAKTEAEVNGTKQVNSLYFMLNGSWKDQIFLDITGRNDWSSALVYTDGTGNFSYFYPSVSSSWIFTETFDLPSFFSFGKIRASWAQVGNDTAPYTINTGYESANWEVDNRNIYLNTKSTTMVDRGIKPERKNSFEIGFDVRFFNNRLSADFAYYNDRTKNQISTIGLPRASGYNKMLTNVGTMAQQGVELSLGFVPIKSKNFEWSSTFNYWHNKTTVKEFIDEMGEYTVLAGNVDYGNYRIGSVAFEGGEYGALMSDILPKVDNNGNKILSWYNSYRGSGYQRSNDVQKVGNMYPDFEGSLDNTFRYKDFSVSILLDARFGGYIASYSNRYGTAYGITESSLKWRDQNHGGITWTSQYADTKGQVFHDGVIPDGVFEEGQMVTAPNGANVNVGGMSYQEAYDAGYVEPTHAALHTYLKNSWGQGVINDDWYSEVKYIAVRNISIGYNLPKSVAHKVKAQNVYVGLNARNIGYLYNNLPNHLNPESTRGTTSNYSYFERNFTPYTATYTVSLSIDF